MLNSTYFEKTRSFEERITESSKVMLKYPDRIPIIVTRCKHSIDIPEIDRKKYLVPKDLTIGQFMYVIRQRIKLSHEKSIYLFVNNNVLPPTCGLINIIYEKHKNRDGFLYIKYAGESTFG